MLKEFLLSNALFGTSGCSGGGDDPQPALPEFSLFFEDDVKVGNSTPGNVTQSTYEGYHVNNAYYYVSNDCARIFRNQDWDYFDIRGEQQGTCRVFGIFELELTDGTIKWALATQEIEVLPE